MPIPLNHLNSIAGCIFPVGLEPWHLTKLLEPGLSLLASDEHSINRRWKREASVGHLQNAKGRMTAREIEECVEILGYTGYKT